MKEIVKMVVTHFFVITVAVLFFTTLGNTMIGIDEVPISYIWQVLLTGIVGALPSFLFYFKKEPTKKQWHTRSAIHLVFIEAIVLTEGGIFGWYSDVPSALMIAGVVVLVYAVVFFYSRLTEYLSTKKINTALQSFNSDEQD